MAATPAVRMRCCTLAFTHGRRNRFGVEPWEGDTELASPAVADGAVLEAGTRVGRYLVERLLGAGGMGVVYASRDPELARSVAIKFVRRPGAEPRAGGHGRRPHARPGITAAVARCHHHRRRDRPLPRRAAAGRGAAADPRPDMSGSDVMVAMSGAA